MSRIKPIELEQATGRTRETLDAVKEKVGFVPNLLGTLANSPAALKGYLAFSEALETGVIPAKLREQIALTISEANGCGYCVAAHCTIGESVGLSEDQLANARGASSADSKVEASLQFTRQLVENRGWVSDEQLQQVRSAGYGDAEITEIIALVAWKTFANYLNHVAETEIDFPAVAELTAT